MIEPFFFFLFSFVLKGKSGQKLKFLFWGQCQVFRFAQLTILYCVVFFSLETSSVPQRQRSLFGGENSFLHGWLFDFVAAKMGWKSLLGCCLCAVYAW